MKSYYVKLIRSGNITSWIYFKVNAENEKDVTAQVNNAVNQFNKLEGGGVWHIEMVREIVR